jgi:hypothetical protein
MTKGEKYLLKLEGSTHFVLVYVLSGKIRLSGFANRTAPFCPAEFFISLSSSYFSGLEKYL